MNIRYLHNGLPVKATDEPWIVNVLGVPYGGPYDGGTDYHGEFFTRDTDLWLDKFPKRPIVYYHGFEDPLPEIIGEELEWWRDEEGVWFKVRLDKTREYARRVYEAAKKGLATASSGAIGHLVRTKENGEIVVWPIGEISLMDESKRPANPLARVELAHAKAVFERAGLPHEAAIEAEVAVRRRKKARRAALMLGIPLDA